jgi:hypothetical protein
LRDNVFDMKRFVYIFFLAAFLGAWMPGVGAYVSEDWRSDSVMSGRYFQQIDAELGSQKTRVPGVESKWIICRNDPINYIDPTGEAANPAGMGDMPQDNLTGDVLWVEAYAQKPYSGNDDYTVMITLSESAGAIVGGNNVSGFAAAHNGDAGRWEFGTVETTGGGSSAGASVFIGIEVSMSGGGELKDSDGTTLELSVSAGEGPSAGTSVNIPFGVGELDLANPIISLSFGWSVGTPIEGHCFVNTTSTQPFQQAPSTNPKPEGTQ